MKTTGCKFNIDMAVSICRNFALATGIELMLLSSDSTVLYATDGAESGFMFCNRLNSIGKESEMCAKTHMYGSVESNRFGGRYIFFCHMGLLHFATPIVKDECMVGSIVSEPILMVDKAEYLEHDILSKYAVDDGDAAELEVLSAT